MAEVGNFPTECCEPVNLKQEIMGAQY